MVFLSLLVVIISMVIYTKFFHYEPVEFVELVPGDVNVEFQDISHWEFGKQIGKGGYSRVFLGRRKTKPGTALLLPPPDPSLGNEKYDHAIKIIPKARYFRQSMDPSSQRLSSLRHSVLESSVWSERNAWVAFSLPTPIPYVIPLSHIFQDRHALYYIVPLINGGDLDRSLNMFGPMNEHTVRFYTASIITALEGMHARGYVYKDIKLKNLLLDEEGKLQMTDFGLTRFATQHHYGSKPTNCVTNGVSGRAGTKSYKAPEILSGQGHSFPSDFYALGVVLYKMMTGQKLYHSDNDIPALKHYLRIPKYHHYTLKQPKWRAYGVFETFTSIQRDLQKMQQSGQDSGETFNVLDYSMQRTFVNHSIEHWLNGDHFNEIGQVGRDKLAKLNGEDSSDGKTNKSKEAVPLTKKKKSKKIKFSPSELFVDGVGPIFGPDDAVQFRTDVENGKVANSKGQIKGKLAWLSLTDDAIDFLTQLTDLNPFYRLGTSNRRFRDYNPESYGADAPGTLDLAKTQINNSSFHPQTGSIVQLNSDVDHHIKPIIQDFRHTQAALLSLQSFDYDDDVMSIADETDPGTHCFDFHTDVNEALPSYKGKDSNGKWKGLHSGFVEIKNHPWFKNFDWDRMAEINPHDPENITPGHQLIQFANVDVKNYNQAKFPDMIDAKDDAFDERYQSIFKGLEFGTKL